PVAIPQIHAQLVGTDYAHHHVVVAVAVQIAHPHRTRIAPHRKQRTRTERTVEAADSSHAQRRRCLATVVETGFQLITVHLFHREIAHEWNSHRVAERVG